MISVTGHIVTDHIFTVPVLPPENSSVPVTNHVIRYGGGAANIAVGIATLGGVAELICAVGKEFAGSDYDKYLDEFKIKKNFYVSDSLMTSTCYAFNDIKGNQTTAFEAGASAMLSEVMPPKMEFVHMATGNVEFNVRAAESSEFSSFDPGQDLRNYDRESLVSIVDNLDILFCNCHELKFMSEIMGIEQSDILELVPTSIVTYSANGSKLYQNHGKDLKEIPAIRVDKMEDPSGAGDSYRAGFFTAYMKGYPMDICCKIGAVTSSFVVEEKGGQTNLANWERMQKRYIDNFGELPRLK